MTIDRAIEILDPEHRENYDGMDVVNEACRMGMEALERTRWIPCYERLPEKSGVYLVAYIATGIVDRLRFYTQYGTGLQAKKNVWVGVIYPCTSNMGVEVIYDNVTHWMPLPKPPKEEQMGLEDGNGT